VKSLEIASQVVYNGHAVGKSGEKWGKPMAKYENSFFFMEL
jgi:hypothetical protein